ncbi:MAG: tRNA pseudouridine(38-40) synthase TruA [Geminicoccaceae bacterium]
MPRYRLLLEYDGGPFAGWQRQPEGRSVQQAVETAIHAFCGEAVVLTAAGRTDAGVHAAGQVAHLDLEREVPPERLMGAVNAHLRPQPVAVLEAAHVDDAFHARFDAVARHYRYRILNRRAPAVLDAGRVWHVPVPLDPERMHDAAQALAGRHDFTSFRAAACQAASAVKTLSRIHVRASGDLVEVAVSARSFLHHQVRNIVGTLKLVGEGRYPVGYVREALLARDRSAAGPTAPPQGLCLVRVDYPT